MVARDTAREAAIERFLKQLDGIEHLDDAQAIALLATSACELYDAGKAAGAKERPR